MGRVLTTIIRVQDKYINSNIVSAQNMGDNLQCAQLTANLKMSIGSNQFFYKIPPGL